MNKPEITHGDWFVNNQKSVMAKTDEQEATLVAVINYFGEDPKEEEANARAISAVPDMIDALIDVVESFEGGYEAKNTLDSIQACKEALRKAGVLNE